MIALIWIVGAIALAGVIAACIGLQAHVGAVLALCIVIVAAYIAFCLLIRKLDGRCS